MLDVRPFLRAALTLAAKKDRRLAGAKLTLQDSTEGGANFIARIRASGGLFFAKLRADPKDRAEREIWALRTISDKSAPSLVYATNVREVLAALAEGEDRALARRSDVPCGALIVTAALSGKTLPILNEADLSSAAAALARLHATRSKGGAPLVGGATAPAMVRFTEECLAQLAAKKVFTAVVLRALTKRVAEARKHVAGAWWDLDETPRALCHGDPRPANILFDRGEASLLDFEHAGLADPMVDLARFVVFSPLSQHQELVLLDAYAEATRAQSLERYFVYRPIAPTFAAIAGAHHWVLAASGEKQMRDRDYAAHRRPLIEQRLSALIGETVKLTAPAAAKPRFKGVIAVDGMAGSGKTPIAALLAKKLALPHFNTGAAYRAVALLAWEKHWSAPRDLQKLLALLERSQLELTADGRITMDGDVLFAALDLIAVEESVAEWARLPEVREALKPILNRAAKSKAAVIEGRDVKTVLVPKAKAFYVTIDPKKRAALVGERAGKGSTRLMKAMNDRDRTDRSRAVAPAVVPKGALQIEGGADLERVVEKMIGKLR